MNQIKRYRSKDYNFIFDMTTGFFIRWGNKKEDDPQLSPSPELLDLEITTICNGYDGTPCPFCYKANNPNGKNMSFDTFKNVFNKINTKVLTQVAFGTDSSLTSNPDTFKMFDYCLNNEYNKVIPNVTVSNIDRDIAFELSKRCGAVAVSRYNKKGICYESVKHLINYGVQTNIHIMVSEETYDQILETINDVKIDNRLSGLNAIVLLSLKQKGRGKTFTPLSYDKFRNIVNEAFSKNINFGFDSCSYYKFEKSIRGMDCYSELVTYSEPCESSLFSSYINVDGEFYPCSFVEGEGEWKTGLDVKTCNDFVNDIWYNEKTQRFRNKLLKYGRKCPYFDI